MNEYHSAAGYVYTAKFALNVADVLDGVFDAETEGIALADIGRALSLAWESTVEALSAHDIDALRAVISVAGEPS